MSSATGGLASAGSSALGFALAIGVVVVALLLGAFWWGSRRTARRRRPVGDPTRQQPRAPRDDSWSTPDERRDGGDGRA
ncbi:DUF6479 family protein [Streptomyces sp. NPDC057854]|uniref:DUF6479 family protein n=1 Tax=Streptomyces sp. NPDC057854 TaxID=3346264 RepID=UPI0004C446BB